MERANHINLKKINEERDLMCEIAKENADIFYNMKNDVNQKIKVINLLIFYQYTSHSLNRFGVYPTLYILNKFLKKYGINNELTHEDYVDNEIIHILRHNSYEFTDYCYKDYKYIMRLPRVGGDNLDYNLLHSYSDRLVFILKRYFEDIKNIKTLKFNEIEEFIKEKSKKYYYIHHNYKFIYNELNNILDYEKTVSGINNYLNCIEILIKHLSLEEYNLIFSHNYCLYKIITFIYFEIPNDDDFDYEKSIMRAIGSGNGENIGF